MIFMACPCHFPSLAAAEIPANLPRALLISLLFSKAKQDSTVITATITAKGQITIPAKIRKALGLDAGARIEFEEVEPGRYVFKPAQTMPVTVIKGVFGKAKRTVSIEDMRAVVAKRAAAKSIQKSVIRATNRR
jgi:AbrB family looped-hinge helix DNA binding protein